MADADGGGRKWLTYGCVGCLMLVGIVALMIGVFFGSAWFGVRSEEVEDRVLTPEIPHGGKPGKVVLRLSAGEFRVRPADPGEPLRVEAKYDRLTYDMQERLETQEDGWTYELEFERTSHIVMSLLKGMVGGTGSKVDVYLPRDVPLDLALWVKHGEVEVELGGLWLTETEIEFTQGGFVLEFDEPLREPLERLAFHGSMGGFMAGGVGNASPRRLEVECSMGGMELDLRGQWVVDSEITIRVSQGGGELRLPRNVEIVGLQTNRSDLRTEAEVQRPTLTFTVSRDRGELEIVE